MEILGWTDEHLDCDVCGKTLDRRRTLAYRTSDGSVQYAGTDCAARIMGTTIDRVRNAADAATTRAARQAQADAANVDRWTRCLAAFPRRRVPDLRGVGVRQPLLGSQQPQLLLQRRMARLDRGQARREEFLRWVAPTGTMGYTEPIGHKGRPRTRS